MQARKMMVCLLVCFVSLLFLSVDLSAITLDAVYEGASGGSWNTASNWSTKTVPANHNQGVLTYNVTIPAGKKVVFDIPGDTTINNFTLGDSGTSDAELELILKNGVKCNLTVIGIANIYDFINGNGGNFTSTVDTDSLEGTRNRAYAQKGSNVSISDTAFTTTGFWGESLGNNTRNFDIITVTGAGSVLDLSTVTAFNAGFNSDGDDNDNHRITVNTGGKLDFSGITTITAPVDADDAVTFYISDPETVVELDGLATITSGGYGITHFVANNNTIHLPQLNYIKRTSYTLGNVASVQAKALTTLIDARFDISGESVFDGSGQPATYNSYFWGESLGNNDRNWNIITITGAGSVLDLSTVTVFNAGFNSDGDDDDNHKIIVSNGGGLLLSSVHSIITPYDGDDLINIIMNKNAYIDLSALTAISTTGSGSGNFNLTIDESKINVGDLNINVPASIILNNHSSLVSSDSIVFNKAGSLQLNTESYAKVKNCSASASATVSTGNAADIIDILGNLNLSNLITMNTAVGTIALGGNYSYTWTDEAKVKKAKIHFNGMGVQKMEVGGLDVDLLIESLTNDNFGLRQMIIGQCDQPTLVQLVDEVNNGNRGGSNPEALYLFGTADDPNGLRIRGGSILMIGDLNVYAMINGTLTRLRDLFNPGETVVAFNEGYIMLGNPTLSHPKNLLLNGGFESGINLPDAAALARTLTTGSGDLTNWTISGDGVDWCHEALFKDADAAGVLSVDLSGNPAGAGIVSQDIATSPGRRYFVWFNLGFNPLGNPAGQAGIKNALVRAAGQSQIFTIDSTIAKAQWPADPTKGWTVPWQAKTWSFVAKDETTTLEFACGDNPVTAYGAAIDNVVVIEGGWAKALAGDMNGNLRVDSVDLDLFADYWLRQDCNGSAGCWCEGADIDRDGDVDMDDFALLTVNWLAGVDLRYYALTVSTENGGTVIKPGLGAFSYLSGSIVEVAAQADEHYHFANWTGSAVEAGKVANANAASTTVRMDGDYTLTAQFAINQYTVEVQTGAGGSVTKPGVGSYPYNYGQVVELAATANANYTFAGWTGTAAGMVVNATLPSTTMTVSGNGTIRANFTPIKRALTVSAGTGGTVITPGMGIFSYDHGSVVAIVAQASEHYQFANWTGTAVSAGKVANANAASTTVTMEGDYTLIANFAIDTHALKISSTDGGNVTVPGEGNYSLSYGTVLNITATKDKYYRFTGWTGTAAVDVTNASLAETTITIKRDGTLVANFAVNNPVAFYDNSLDQNPNWTAQGQWAFGVPIGLGGTLFGKPDPTAGATGGAVYGVNLMGDYDPAIGGPHRLTTSAIDCSGFDNIRLKFKSWLNSDNSRYVVHKVEVSSNGTQWNNIWTQSGNSDILSDSWTPMEYDISGYADAATKIYVRWSYQVLTERAYSYAGWNIDDVQLTGTAE